MVGILGHRPKRYAYIVPKVRRISRTKIPLFRTLPVFRLSVLPIRSDYPASHFHSLDIEIIILTILHGKPNILHSVLPIIPCSPTFLSLPSYSVKDRETGSFKHSLQSRCGFPIATKIERTVRLQLFANFIKPSFEITDISPVIHSLELHAMEIFRQIIRWIDNRQVGETVRDSIDNRQQIGMYYFIEYIFSPLDIR